MNDIAPTKETIDLQLVLLFVTIARSQTIAAAARQLNISPSLATRRLALLERVLQARLFQRTTRALHLTAAGHSTLEWAENTLEDYERLKDDLSVREKTPEGLIRLAVSDYALSFMLPEFLADFMIRHPRISYDLRTTDHLINPVEHCFDVAVHSGFMPDSSLIGVPVRPVQRILCAAPAYLARMPALRTPDDLSSHTCLTHGATETSEWFFERRGVITGQKVEKRLCVDSFVALRQFALQGMGIIRISSNMVRSNIESGALVPVLPEWRCVQSTGDLPSLWLIYPNRKLPYRVRTFIAEMRRYLEPRMSPG